ncbi:HAMP domain-containing histidine kinase [Hymenobacter busanensis]|uniref:histidine kinase n=1 Tax=Hymenobacter busanensis TaxID=2607656 RepID=A0A7L4ZT38_9BACT|nr:HAMP domain-containing sensor histidine kinase [Hymenobacter busanensis]KAA9327713.1 HAMP domain-containing histidine kinase [Hymenobacter busanensis]QHJ05946.1 PAS domain S-box protein [Hymenobacter busanensis]
MLTPADCHAVDAENQVLRAENQRLRACLADAQARQANADDKDGRQARFRTVFENSPFGQKIITPDLIIRQANRAVAQMLGVPDAAALLGRQILEFAHPDHRADWAFLQQRLWNHKLPYFTLETCLMRPDGSSFWCQVTSIRFPDAGQELGYTLLEDISERKAIELSLKRLYDAQETILHLVTHDLKTPIAHIQLLTDLLERQGTGAAGLAADTQHYLDLIRRACREADKLLKDVLMLGSLDARHLPKCPTDLCALLHERLAAHKLAAQAKGLALVLNAPAAVHANLNADAFGRVVDNLVSNALKFTPPGGCVSVGVREEAGVILLTVRDSGIGIPAALQEQLFEKFSAAARPGVAGEASTGLGLFITKQIVQLHRGKLWVESREGEGSCFFVELR